MPARLSGRWLWLMLAVLVADRATKYILEQSTTEGFRRELVRNVAWLVHSKNPGIAFGLLAESESGWIAAVLIAISVAAVFWIGWLLVTGHAGGAPTQAGLALIGGGAAGNLYDRVLHGGVTDFIELHAGRFQWPAFNLADSAITIGALLVLYEFLRGGQHTARARA